MVHEVSFMAIIAMRKEGLHAQRECLGGIKNQLSKYLTFAKGGEEVVIRDRNLPVAKLVPFSAEGADDQELVLVAAGKLRLPKVRLNVKELLKIPTDIFETRRFKPFSPTEQNDEESHGVLGCQRVGSLVYSRSGESSRSIPPEEIQPRGLVGKPSRSL